MDTKTGFWPIYALIVPIFLAVMAPVQTVVGQTLEEGPWWPSPHGAQDQAG